MGVLTALRVTGAVVIVLIIILTIVIPYYFLIIRGTQWYSRWGNHHISDQMPISEAYSTLKTGDLILFASTTQVFTHHMLQTYFTHSSMVVREGDLVYLTEAQSGDSLIQTSDGKEWRTNSGATLTPFLSRIKYYMGPAYHLRLSQPLDPDAEEAIKAEADKLCADAYPYPDWLQGIYGFLTKGTISARHCFQHVAHLLDVGNLTPVDLPDGAASTGFVGCGKAIAEISGKKLPGGRYYHKPVELIYDVT